MSSYSYTVPTDTKTIASVQSSVLAVGVALLFLFIVSLQKCRSTSSSRYLSPSSSTGRRRREIALSRSCWRHPECYISMSSPVSLARCSDVLHIPALLLRPPLRNSQLDHAGHRRTDACLLHCREVMQGADSLGLYVFRVPSCRCLLDYSRTYRGLRLVRPAASICRLAVIHQIYVFYLFKQNRFPVRLNKTAFPKKR